MRSRYIISSLVAAIVAAVLPMVTPIVDTASAIGMATVSGVMSTDGGPFEGGTVSLFALRDGANVGSIATGADGRFAFPDLDDGEYGLTASGPGLVSYSRGWNSDPIVVADGVNVDASFIAVRSGSIRGRIIDGDGEPVSDVYVEVNSAMVGMSVDVRPDGSFMQDGLPPGEYVLSAAHDRRPTVTSTFTVRDGQMLDLGDVVVATLEAIRGTVSRSGGPTAGVNVWTMNESGQIVVDTTDTDGRYRLAVGPGDRYQVRFEPSAPLIGEWFDDATDVADATMVVVAPGADTTGIDAVLASTASVWGVVSDQNGMPVAGVTVFGPAGAVTTGADGAYVLADLPIGTPIMLTYVLASIRITYEVTLESGELVEYDPVLEVVRGSLSGTVRDEAGEPVEGATISLTDGGLRTTLSDAGGNYRFDDLIVGDLLISVTATDAEHVDLAVSIVAAGTVQDVVLPLLGAITGTVTAGGLPAPGVQVTASQVGGDRFETIVTDDDGRYSLTGLRAGAWKLYFARWDVFAEFYDNAASFDMATPVAVVGRAATDVDVDLTMHARMAGVVTNQNGAPIWDVSVRATHESGRVFAASTGRGGDYLITGMIAGRYDVVFDVDGRQSTTTIDLVAGETGTADARLEVPNGTLRGTITDELGEPLPGITLYNGAIGLTLTTDTQGQYRIDTLHPGTYSFSVGGGLTFPTTITAQIADGRTTVVDVTLTMGGRIAGTVTADGRPNVSSRVTAHSLDNPGVVVEGSVSWAGNYQFAPITPGRWVIRFGGDWWMGTLGEWFDDAPTRELATPVVVTRGQTTAAIDADLATGGRITGVLTMSDGRPMPRATVMSGPGPDAQPVGDTDSSGRYRTEALPPGTYALVFVPGRGLPSVTLGEDGAPAAVTINGSETVELDVRLSASFGAIHGRVVDTAGQPIARADLLLVGSVLRSQYSWPDGSFVYDGLAQGNYSLRVAAAGHITKSVTATVVNDETVDLVVTLAAGGRGVGRVVDSAGHPLAGVVVTATPAFWALGGPRSSPPTGEDGLYDVGPLQGGYDLLAWMPGYAPVKAEVTVDGAADVTTDLTLLRTGSVSGRVVGFDDQPIAGADIFAGGQRMTVGDDGAFSFTGVPPGPADVAASAQGYITGVSPVVVPEGGAVTDVVVKLERYGTVIGRVVDAAGQPVAGTFVSWRKDVEPIGGSPRVVTSATGTFEFPFVIGGGTIVIEAVADRFPTQAFDADGTPGPDRFVVVDGARIDMGVHVMKSEIDAGGAARHRGPDGDVHAAPRRALAMRR